MPTYYPPVGFSIVESGLYRSGLPVEVNFPFLEQLGLQTLLYLYPEAGPLSPSLQAFVEDQGINVLRVGDGVSYSAN